MPAKGDIVSERELQLSSACSELIIERKSDEMITYAEIPGRRYNIKAKVGMIHFDMELIVVESSGHNPNIEKMSVQIEGVWKYELDLFIQRVQLSKEPTSLLIGLRSYINELQYRSDVWTWMKNKWGSCIAIPAGQYSNSIIICKDKTVTPSNSPKFLLVWKVDFSMDFIVVPKIYPFFELDSKDAGKRSQLLDLHDRIIKVFGELLEVKGIESAILFLMDCVK